MNARTLQLSLFDTASTRDPAQQADALARMRAMINHLAAATSLPWKSQMEAIPLEGSFRRAMWLVPKDQAQALWAEFDAHMDRLDATTTEANDPPPKKEA